MKRAVLFDWRGTLVVAPSLPDVVRDGLARCNRTVGPDEVARLVSRVMESNGPDDRMDTPGMDADPSLHREITMQVLADAGLDSDLADAIYASESSWERNTFAVDAAATIRRLADADIAIGVVSDIHFDVRPAFQALGVSDAVGAYALSYEVHAQKPDPAIFWHALDALGVHPSDTLFVGDRSGPDGAAVENGMMTLLLPPLRSPHDARLDAVTRLLISS